MLWHSIVLLCDKRMALNVDQDIHACLGYIQAAQDMM